MPSRRPLVPRRVIPVLVGALLAALWLAVSASAGSVGASLDQCANGPLLAPADCSASGDWVNGNLNSVKSHYQEGDSVPYRLTMTGVSLASHTVVVQWDTLQGGKHAIDYVTSFGRTVTGADPCAGVTGCSAPADTAAIPADSAAPAGAQVPGSISLYGGTITAVGPYVHDPSGDQPTSLTITFTASVANPVLAWGGHIASSADWGTGNSAASIPGSPYHMRFLSLDGTGGNQDRSLTDVTAAPATPPPPPPPPAATPAPTATFVAQTAAPVLVTTTELSRSCASRRVFKIRVRQRHGQKLVSATVRVNGRSVAVLRGRRLLAPVILRGLPKGTFQVEISATLANGKRLHGKRTYHTCIPRIHPATIPVL